MPITAITIENFKCIQEPVRIEFKPVTLLFGPNSSGKSTILQALHYAREVFERENVDPGQTIGGGKPLDLGGFENLVCNHNLSLPIIIKLDLDLKDEDLPVYVPKEYISGGVPYLDELAEASGHASRTTKTAWVEIRICYSNWLKKPIVDSYEVGINDNLLARITASKDGRQIMLSYYDWDYTGNDDVDIEVQPGFNEKEHSDVPLNIFGQLSALPRWGQPLDIESSVKYSDLDDDMARYFTDYGLSKMHTWIVGPGEMVRDALRKLLYIGPLRELPPRNYLPERSPDAARWSSGIMSWDVLYRAEKSFIKEINQWLTRKDRLNSGYRIEVKRFKELDINDPITMMLSGGPGLEEVEIIQSRVNDLPVKSRVAIREEMTGIELMPQDVGIGISQVLPVIVGALYVKEGIFSIEQPELHIHPAFQVALGDLFISQIQEKNVSFLLETHSEHLMLRFLRRIRETSEDELPPGKWPLKPDQLAVYYLEQSDKGVKTTKIRIDEDGEFIDCWPKGFFDEREDELLY